jgi:hypothetical protein
MDTALSFLKRTRKMELLNEKTQKDVLEAEMNNIEVKITPVKGSDIQKVCGEVKELSEFLKQDIYFEFNGVSISTLNKSINEMVESYTKAR